MADLKIGGKSFKKSTLLIAGGGVGLVGFLWYRHKSSSSAAASSAATPTDTTGDTSTDQYPADGTVGDPSDPNSTDPATGQTYGDEAASGYSDYGGYGNYVGSAAGGYGYGDTSTLNNAPGSFTSNGMWMQYAEQQLENSGIDPTTLSAALGKYLVGGTLTSDQA